MIGIKIPPYSPPPQGSARSFDFFRLWTGGTGVGTDWIDRNGDDLINVTQMGGGPEQSVTRKGVKSFRMQNGKTGSNELSIPFNTRETSVKSWHVGLWVWETVMQWTVELFAGVDNGMWFTDQQLGNVYSGATQGFGIAAVDGLGLCFYANGPLGIVTESLNISNSLQEWHHVRWVFRNRSARARARLQLYVNDILKVQRFWDTPEHGLPALNDSITGQDRWRPCWGHLDPDPSVWLYYRDQHFYGGPDLPGVL